MKVQRQHENIRYRKSEFGYKNKSRDYEPADFAWLLKRTKPEDAKISTRAALANVWKPELDQEFDGKGLKDAEKWAKHLLEEGLADGVWVRMHINIEGYLGRKYVHGWTEVEDFRIGLDG